MTLNNISIFLFSTEQVRISVTLCNKQSTLCLTAKSPDNDDDDDDDDYDSSNDDSDSVDDDFNENNDSDNDDGGNDVGDDGGEDDADNDDGDENDNNMDVTGDDETTEEHELPQQIHELNLEGQIDDFDESDLEKVNIHEYVY